MRALRFTHVAIHADDMETSLAFYVEVLGMRRVPSPDFEQHVEWLQLGDQQLHLFRRETPAPAFHHLGLEVNDGSVQMYLRDPAGNLVEVNWPDAASLDRTVVTEIHKLADERPQSPDALRARLFGSPTDCR